MGYTRVKHLSAGHNSVDYHENAPRGPGERGFPGEAICRAHHHRRARGGWGGRVGSLRARRARRERSELKSEHTGGTRAAFAARAARK